MNNLFSSPRGDGAEEGEGTVFSEERLGGTNEGVGSTRSTRGGGWGISGQVPALGGGSEWAGAEIHHKERTRALGGLGVLVETGEIKEAVKVLRQLNPVSASLHFSDWGS